MADKNDKKDMGVLDIVSDFKHLANPFYSLMHVAKPGTAPGGKWALAKDPNTNMALWNALGVASWLVPTSALAAYFTNKWWEKRMRDASNKSSVSRIAAVRPVLSPDDDLTNIKNIVEDPSKEVDEVLTAIEKTSSGNNSAVDSAGKWVKDVATSTIPLFTIPLSMIATKLAVDKIYSNRMKSRLEDERVAIRNHQNKLDHELMTIQGLVKGASSKQNKPVVVDGVKITKDDVADYRKRRDEEAKGKRGAVHAFMSWPILTTLMASGGLAALAFNYLKKHDKAGQTLEYVRKKSLGHNIMQTTPELGIEQFGVPVQDIVARPGDKKQPGYELAQNAVDANNVKALVEASAADTIADLEEVKPANKKSGDALF